MSEENYSCPVTPSLSLYCGGHFENSVNSSSERSSPEGIKRIENLNKHRIQ